MSEMRQIPANSFDALLEAAVDAIIIIDARGRILRFNRAAQSMFDYTEAEAVGRNVKMLMPEPVRDSHDRYLREHLAGKEGKIIGVGREETAIRSDGRTFPIHLSVGRAQIEDEVGFVGIIRDLSIEKQAQDAVRELEHQLIHADRLVTLGELAAGIAHEINQPLTAIAAYADAGKRLVGAEQTDGDELRLICERVAEQARRAGGVVTRLRSLARKGAVKKASHDLEKIVKNVVLIIENQIEKEHILLVFDIDEQLPVLHVDDIQIQQVLINLVKNSMDAIAQEQPHSGRIELTARQRDAWVEVSVVDNGPGVGPDVVHRLFEPFFTTKSQGVGLGLAICKNIAAAHGGGLTYEPALNGGSRFVLILPLDSMG